MIVVLCGVCQGRDGARGCRGSGAHPGGFARRAVVAPAVTEPSSSGARAAAILRGSADRLNIRLDGSAGRGRPGRLWRAALALGQHVLQQDHDAVVIDHRPRLRIQKCRSSQTLPSEGTHRRGTVNDRDGERCRQRTQARRAGWQPPALTCVLRDSAGEYCLALLGALAAHALGALEELGMLGVASARGTRVRAGDETRLFPVV